MADSVVAEAGKDRESLLRDLLDDWQSTDIRISLFSSAAFSFKYESLLKPIRSDYKNEHGEVDVEKVWDLLSKLPRLSSLLHCDISSHLLEFLHCVVSPVRGNSPKLRSVARSELLEVYRQEKWDILLQKPEPHAVFEVIPSQLQKSKWDRISKDRRTFLAFHGSKLENFHSILNLGLQQHLNKTGIFGEGIYLSTEMSLSMQYSKGGQGWTHSQFGPKLAVLALCEFVDHPDVTWNNRRTSEGTNIPQKYILVTNNELVRLRYLFVYRESPVHKKTKSWLHNRFLFLVAIYAVILLGIGLSRSNLFS